MNVETVPARAEAVEPGRRAVAASPHLVLTLLWCGLAAAYFGLLWLDAREPAGLVSLGFHLPISPHQRLIPLAALILLGLGFAAMVFARRLAPAAAALPEWAIRHSRAAACLVIGFGFAASLAAVWLLRAFPNSGDEYAYLFEARTFAAGRLWNAAPPLPELFAHYHILIADGRWLALYAPGWPVLMTAVMTLRLPVWLACPIAGALLLWAVWRLGWMRDGPLGGVLAVGLVATAPFFLFNAASYFSHVPATAAGLLFCVAALRFLDRPRLADAVFAGIALGIVGLIRTEDVLPFAAPFAVQFLWRARGRHYRLAPAIVIAGLPFLAALLLYYHSLFGSALPPVHLESGSVRFGFYPVDEFGNRLTPLGELYLVGARLVMLAEWSSPFLVLGYAAALVRLCLAWRRLSFVDFIFPALVLGFLVVPFDGGNQYGPRYYFEGFPLLVLTLVSALAPLLPQPGRRTACFACLVMAHAAISLAAAAVLGPWMRAVIDERMDVFDQARAEHLHDAVVAVRSGAGLLRPMAPLDLTQNGIAVRGPVIYVLDVPGQLQKLHALLPHWRFYAYERDPLSAKGHLRPLFPG